MILMMKITIDLERLSRLNLSPNHFCYLYCKHYGLGYSFTGIIDDSDLEHLAGEGYIKIVEDLVILRAKALNLFKVEDELNDVSSWIDTWREIFPVGVKSMGYAVRGDRTGCIKKMRAFLKQYPDFDKELIFNATKIYVDAKRKEKWSYMQLAHYFIEKDGISNLAALCEDLKTREQSGLPAKDADGSDFTLSI